jgi:flagellar motility protein MotE (MotC chaperone)
MAATYDKMNPASAGTILTNMSKAKTGSPNDAVKILHYMGDRTKANLLAELANSEPVLAAYFCQKLKQITEEN